VKDKWIFYTLTAAIGFWLWQRYQANMPLLFYAADGQDGEVPDEAPGIWDSSLEFLQPDVETEDMNSVQNRSAFLSTLKASEGVGFGYYTLYGNTKWNGDLSDHPAMQGWPGVTLPDNFCKNAGINPPCKSYAAGAYQINRSTWRRIKAKLNLPDFSENSQDLAAIELIRENGALDLVDSGDVIGAAKKVAGVWASLPGSTSGQPKRSEQFIVAQFEQFLNEEQAA